MNLRRDVNFDQWQIFGAIQYVLWKRLLIKNVFGYALANLNPTEVTPLPEHHGERPLAPGILLLVLEAAR